MGNQGASNPQQQLMIEWFNQGLIGTVHTINVWTDRPVWPQGIPTPTERPERPSHISAVDWDLYIGPATPVDYHPLYHPFKWRGWWNFGTGALGDMGCHMIDAPFRVLELGYPTEVECSVGQVYTRDWVPEFIPEGCPPSSTVRLKFPKTKRNDSEVAFTWSDGGIRPFHPDLMPADHMLGSNSNTNGVMMIGTKGLMVCGYYGLSPKVYRSGGEIIEAPEDYGADQELAGLPEFGHQVAWTRACKAGYDSDEHKALTSSFDMAGPLTETVPDGQRGDPQLYVADEPKRPGPTRFLRPPQNVLGRQKDENHELRRGQSVRHPRIPSRLGFDLNPGSAEASRSLVWLKPNVRGEQMLAGGKRGRVATTGRGRSRTASMLRLSAGHAFSARYDSIDAHPSRRSSWSVPGLIPVAAGPVPSYGSLSRMSGILFGGGLC